MKPTTLDTLALDQVQRIDRNNLKTGDNAILDWINNFNEETIFINNLLSR